MILPPQEGLQRTLWGDGSIVTQTPRLGAQADTGRELAREWANPSVVIATVLMFFGGNVVQEALAQTAENVFTPVCFSFGWVTYAFTTLKDVFGEGRLLPVPDYPVKVFNVSSGYYRVNKNWLIGRIVRDHESWISKFEPLRHSSIRIAIFEAMPVAQRKSLPLPYHTRYIFGISVGLVQLVIAAIPTIRTEGHEWGILAVTGLGILLVIVMGTLPQWYVEKIPTKQDSKKVFALTGGNGSRDVMIIKGEGRCIDLEELATLDSPATGIPWTILKSFSVPGRDLQGRDAKMLFGRPLGFQLTRLVCIFEVIGWLLILISLAGIRSHTWCLFAIGAIGLIHNSLLADLKRDPKTRNLPLKLLDIVSSNKIMDGLMDLEVTHEKCGRALLQEFFPGNLRPDEDAWWKSPPANRRDTEYDRRRLKERKRRLHPRSVLPNYNLHATCFSPTSPTAPENLLGRAIDQTVPTIATPVRREVPTVKVLGSPPLSQDASQYQSNVGFIGEQLSRARSFGSAKRPVLGRAASAGLPDARSFDPSSGMREQGGPVAEEDAEGPVGARPASMVDSRPTLEDIAKKMPERPYWD